jgi:hypothetical protein
MLGPIQRIAVYTTIYPGSEAYLLDWYRSVKGQEDQNFQLWIGLDGIGSKAVESVIGSHVEAMWVPSRQNDTPARIRQRSLTRIAEKCDAVVLVDSDDVMHPSRVASARVALQSSDVTGCALRLVDEQMEDSGDVLTLSGTMNPEDVLPRNNVFGFSNSAYRSELLRRCLPIPAEAELVDWYMATRAWMMGATLTFDPIPRMDYRQYGANMAPIRFPFDKQQVTRDTRKVLEHFRLLQASPLESALSDRLAKVQEVATEVQLFYERVVLTPGALESYVRELNRLELHVVWWWDVAQPTLQWMWKDHA